MSTQLIKPNYLVLYSSRNTLPCPDRLAYASVLCLPIFSILDGSLLMGYARKEPMTLAPARGFRFHSQIKFDREIKKKETKDLDSKMIYCF